MECIPFACPSCGARMYFVQETKATTCGFSLTMEVRFIKNFHLVRPCFRNRFSKLKSKPVPFCCALIVEASTLMMFVKQALCRPLLNVVKSWAPIKDPIL